MREPFWRGHQLPGVGDGIFLEIIAEGKIAEHFEKGVVAIGEADIFEVVVLAAGADAFLAGGGAVVVALFEAEEDVLELVHPGIGEEQRGVAVGTSEELRTRRWPLLSKNCRNVLRISLPVMNFLVESSPVTSASIFPLAESDDYRRRHATRAIVGTR